MDAKILLSPRELLYIAATLDAAEFIGVSDAFFGMAETEIQQEIQRLKLSLTEKGYADMNFDGDFTLKKEILDVVDCCGNCDALLVVDKHIVGKAQLREFFYAKNGLFVNLKEDVGIYRLSPISGVGDLREYVKRDMEWQYVFSEPLRDVMIPAAILSAAKANAENQSVAAGIETLIKSGCNENSAKVILDGLSERANYYAAVSTVFNGERTGSYSRMLINAAGGIYQFATLFENDEEILHFVSLTVEQAQQAFEDVIGQISPLEREA